MVVTDLYSDPSPGSELGSDMVVIKDPNWDPTCLSRVQIRIQHAFQGSKFGSDMVVADPNSGTYSFAIPANPKKKIRPIGKALEKALITPNQKKLNRFKPT